MSRKTTKYTINNQIDDVTLPYTIHPKALFITI